MSRLVAFAASALLAGSLASGCGGDSSARPSDPVLAKGQDVHRARCASCHGIDGSGGLGKKLSGGQVTRDLPDPADHIRIVTNGLKGTTMAAWGDTLTAEEIQAVVRYQREVLAAKQ